MKKQIIALMAVLCVVTKGQSQSMYLGALVIDANAGIEGMSTEYNYRYKNLSIEKDTTIKDGAANSNFSFGAEVGLAKWISVGGRAKFNTYFTSEDKVTKTRPDAHSFEVLGTLNLHITHNKHFNLLFGGNMGYSGLTYNSNDVNKTSVEGKGTYADLHLTARVYIRRFGFHVSAYTPFVSYNNMTSNNDVFNSYIVAKWKGQGFGMNIGVQYRFFSVRKDLIN
ncbi:MAG: hypothetical protein QM534_17220 [Sediminibacterium sp.]|nr:hypothetical protein [Sediminibacterium sp.]